jgi:hypothetical protein
LIQCRNKPRMCLHLLQLLLVRLHSVHGVLPQVKVVDQVVR